jgi:hypothetical protein
VLRRASSRLTDFALGMPATGEQKLRRWNPSFLGSVTAFTLNIAGCLPHAI